MSVTSELLPGSLSCPVLVVCDHASNALPGDVNFGLTDAQMNDHIAWDIGAAALGKALNRDFGFPYFGALYSRLFVDLNRHRDDPAVIPEISDGVTIAVNILSPAQREARLSDYYDSYHAELINVIERLSPSLIIAMHSFTPCLGTGEPRQWEVGVLYNEIECAARKAMDLLRDEGLIVGDQEPYSGKQFYATLEKQAEARNIACACIEIRQDLVANETGISRFSGILGPICQKIVESLA